MVQTNSVKQKIVIISGPTAVGKSNFAVNCALKFNGEVISADSMQIYKGMDIGTGKVTIEEMQGVTHHMLDIASPDERYSVGRYVQECVPIIDEILSRDKLPIIVGGTGLYINALINGMNFSDADRSDEVRDKWKLLASQNGIDYVYNHLCEIDSKSAEKISRNDLKRIIRAIEIYEVTGKKKSEIASTSDCPYEYLLLILNYDREALYARINTRVDQMVKLGLESEVETLRKHKDCQSLQAIGYKQFVDFFEGKYETIEQTVEEIKKASRNYAKRQLTFLRGMNSNNKEWITPQTLNIGYDLIEKFLMD